MSTYFLLLFLLMLQVFNGIAAPTRFGERFCHENGYVCLTVGQDQTWDDLFPDLEQQDLIKRLNRMNISLRPGIKIAVPKKIDELSIYDISPFPRYIQPTGEKTIYVDQRQLAWGAYNTEGELIWWGPISAGSGHCKQIDGECITPSGSFRVIRKQDIDCISTAFPKRSDGIDGGAEMPYCMHFFRGYALHGSMVVPGYPASHGCVRLFIEDAQWLNEEFVDLPGAGGLKGTRVIID